MRILHIVPTLTRPQAVPLRWSACCGAMGRGTTSRRAFALPSHQENSGIAVVEALACAS